MQGTLLVGVALCLALQAWLALVMEINWDEFFYLSHIYDYQRGEFTKTLQAIHVHLFAWITSLPGDEIAKIEVGRLVMLGCFGGTCTLVYALSRGFVSRTAALVSVLSFASVGFSIIHGASFRADPIAAMFAMGSLVVVARAQAGWVSAIAAGALAAVAAMITIKVTLYAPAFLGIGAWRLLTTGNRRATFLWLGGASVSAAAAFAFLYLVQLGLVPKGAGAASSAGLANAAETQMGAGLLPRLQEIVQFVLLSPAQTILLLTGLGGAGAMLHDRDQRPEAIALVGCGASLLCLLYYRNAFPYFFPFILAPAAILAAWAVEQVPALMKHVALIAIALTTPAVAVAVSWSKRDQNAQQQVVSIVHDLFPQAVHYIDRNGMIASYPKRGFFMSTWGMQNYRRAGVPVFDQVLARDTVPLVIVNGPALQDAFGERERLPAEYSLLDGDKATLRRNYVHHWGPLWVAGMVLEGAPEGTRFDVLVPGMYTVEGADVSIDGRALRASGLVALSRGGHVLRAPAGKLVTLKWGDRLARPTQTLTGPIYWGF